MTPSKHTLQYSLEELFSKNQLMQRMQEEFRNHMNIDFESQMDKFNIPYDFGYALLVQMALHKRASAATLLGLLRRHHEALEALSAYLMACVDADLVDYYDDLEMFVVVFEISPETQYEIDRYQYPLPCVIPPKEVNTNKDTGYYTYPVSSGSLILRNNHHNDDICLDHINAVNAVPLTINTKVMALVRNQWKNLDKKKPDESVAEFNQRKKAFDKYNRTSKEILSLLIEEGNTFYLTHKYDKRGRTYCQGYHANYQGTDWNKACIEFAEKEYV